MTTIEEPPEAVVPLPPTQVLQAIGLGLGTASGYSGDDLTSPHRAIARGEVPYLRSGDRSHPLELRIHGVGGAPPMDNLETPTVLQVAGDGDAGFYRAWYPGGSACGRPRVEAYCWGRLTTGSRWAALWPLLMPFGLVNLAYWALPKTRGALGWPLGALLRLLGLVLTGMFVGTATFLCLDMVAWQSAGSAKKWSWLHFYFERPTGLRMALAAAPVLAVIALLYCLSRRTQSRYEEKEAGHGLDDASEWPLARRSFWQGAVPMTRQRRAHMTLSGAVLMTVLALPPIPPSWARTALLTAAGVLAAWSGLVVALPGADRMETRNRPPSVSWKAANSFDRCAVIGQAVALLGAVALAGARIGWGPVQPPVGAIPGDLTLQTSLTLAAVGLVVLLSVALAGARPWVESGSPAGERDQPVDRAVMGLGFAAAGLAALAATMAVVFGGTLTQTAANLLGNPVSQGGGESGSSSPSLLVPPTVYASGFALIFAIGAAVVLGIALLQMRQMSTAALLQRGDDTVEQVYGTGRACQPEGADTAARRAVARTWATARLTDHAAVLLFGLTIPTAAAFVMYSGLLIADATNPVLTLLTGWGATVGVLATGLLIAFVRGAFSDISQRKRFGFLWDVLTFWPRACHPLSPPCYAERTIPEVVTRIRRVVGDSVIDGDRSDPALALELAERCTGDDAGPYEAQSPVLLVGYSQGSPIATAVVAQLPADVRTKIALLTLASPARRLYGRTFPAYFGHEHLGALMGLLDGRWRNLVRESDYIGGYVLSRPRPAGQRGGAVDQLIWDPPVLWTDADPTPPPTHMHSDWFSDPQTRPHADELARRLAEGQGQRSRDHRPGDVSAADCH